jgi:hypothetical protein
MVLERERERQVSPGRCIDLIGPGERARRQIGLSKAAGIPIYLKSEPEISLEAPGLPHILCLDRWFDRADALASSGANGAWVFPAGASLPVMEADVRLEMYYGGAHTFSHGADMIRAKISIIDREINVYLPGQEMESDNAQARVSSAICIYVRARSKGAPELSSCPASSAPSLLI